MDGAGLDRRRLSDHAHDFVAIRIHADGMDVVAAEILNEKLKPDPFFSMSKL
jgi:hypothetical protein